MTKEKLKVILLCAGYGTRIQKIIGSLPKALIQVDKDITVLDVLCGQLNSFGDIISEVHLVTNDVFYKQFMEWGNNTKDRYRNLPKIHIHNDMSTDNSNRLGAIGDICFTLDKIEDMGSDHLLVLATDNLYPFHLQEVVDFFFEKECRNLITARKLDLEEIKQKSEIKIDEQGRVIYAKEKPANPVSNYSAYAIYFINNKDIALYEKYLAEGNNPDSPGNFLPYLIEHSSLYCFKFENEVLDFGCPDLYEKCFETIKKNAGEYL